MLAPAGIRNKKQTKLFVFLKKKGKNLKKKNDTLDACSTISYTWEDWCGVGWLSLGGMRYRAPYGAIKLVCNW